MKKRAVTLAVLTLLVIAVLPIGGTAQADPIAEFLGCDPVPQMPTISYANNSVSAGGHASGPTCSTAVKSVEVCLDFDGVTVPETCRTYGSPSGGASRPYMCVPGLYESMVIVRYNGGAVEIAHSLENQSALVVTTQCLR